MFPTLWHGTVPGWKPDPLAPGRRPEKTEIARAAASDEDKGERALLALHAGAWLEAGPLAPGWKPPMAKADALVSLSASTAATVAVAAPATTTAAIAAKIGRPRHSRAAAS